MRPKADNIIQIVSELIPNYKRGQRGHWAPIGRVIMTVMSP